MNVDQIGHSSALSPQGLSHYPFHFIIVDLIPGPIDIGGFILGGKSSAEKDNRQSLHPQLLHAFIFTCDNNHQIQTSPCVD